MGRKSKYFILSITEWGTVQYVDNDSKINEMDINDYLEYCCE